MEFYTGIETRTSSISSESTGDESTTQQDSQGTEAMSMEWTDQKHSLYLKSMETSFVNQLHNSMDLLGQSSQTDTLDSKAFQKVHCESCTTAGQFKVLRRGCWQRISFEEPMSHADGQNKCQAFLTSPWIRHFKYGKTSHIVPCPALHETAALQRQVNDFGGKKTMSSGSATSSKPPRLHPLFSFQNVPVEKEEGSDQNFVEEEIKHEVSNDSRSSKRMKTLKESNHVVPSGEFPDAEDVSKNRVMNLDNKLASASPN